MYVESGQVGHVRSVLAVHEPVRYCPAKQLVVQFLQTVGVGGAMLSWNVFTGQVEHLGLVVEVHVPFRNEPGKHWLVQLLH